MKALILTTILCLMPVSMRADKVDTIHHPNGDIEFRQTGMTLIMRSGLPRSPQLPDPIEFLRAHSKVVVRESGDSALRIDIPVDIFTVPSPGLHVISEEGQKEFLDGLEKSLGINLFDYDRTPTESIDSTVYHVRGNSVIALSDTDTVAVDVTPDALSTPVRYHKLPPETHLLVEQTRNDSVFVVTHGRADDFGNYTILLEPGKYLVRFYAHIYVPTDTIVVKTGDAAIVRMFNEEEPLFRPTGPFSLQPEAAPPPEEGEDKTDIVLAFAAVVLLGILLSVFAYKTRM